MLDQGLIDRFCMAVKIVADQNIPRVRRRVRRSAARSGLVAGTRDKRASTCKIANACLVTRTVTRVDRATCWPDTPRRIRRHRDHRHRPHRSRLSRFRDRYCLQQCRRLQRRGGIAEYVHQRDCSHCRGNPGASTRSATAAPASSVTATSVRAWCKSSKSSASIACCQRPAAGSRPATIAADLPGRSRYDSCDECDFISLHTYR